MWPRRGRDSAESVDGNEGRGAAPRAQAHSLQQGFCTILTYLIGLKNCECE